MGPLMHHFALALAAEVSLLLCWELPEDEGHTPTYALQFRQLLHCALDKGKEVEGAGELAHLLAQGWK